MLTIVFPNEGEQTGMSITELSYVTKLNPKKNNARINKTTNRGLYPHEDIKHWIRVIELIGKYSFKKFIQPFLSNINVEHDTMKLLRVSKKFQ